MPDDTISSSPATSPDIALMSVPETLATLRVDPNTGLTRAVVDRCRQEYGFNEVKERKEHPIFKFLGKFWGLSAWMLELIMVLSLVMRHYSDLAIVGALLFFNGVLGFVQERRAIGVMQTLQRRLQVSARVLRDSTWQVLSSVGRS